MGKDPRLKGEQVEAVVMQRLMEHGAVISRPWSTVRYDLIVDYDNTLYKVQVKTASDKSSASDGAITFHCVTNMLDGTPKTYTADEVDAYAIYYHGTDEVYWIPFEDAAEQQTTLRFNKPASSNQYTQRMAYDYTLEKQL